MKRLFGQRPKSSKHSQANAIPTPVSTDEFARAAAAQQKSLAQAQEDPWVVVKDPMSRSPGQVLPDRSRSNSTNASPPGVTLSPPFPGTNNGSQYPQGNPYANTPQQSNHSLLAPNHIQNNTLKKPLPPVHGAAAILRSLDPDQSSLARSVSPSLESLPLNGEIDRDPRSAERRHDAERERERQREWEQGRERERDKERERERQKEKERSRDKERHRNSVGLRDRDHDRDQGRGRERDRDRERTKEKEKRKGIFSSGRDKDKERERNGQAELTRMIGFLTATASEDWSLVLEVCERASASEAAAKEASKALRREFKYAEPGAQLSAARLWAIMLQNCSEIFIVQASSKKFLDSLEEVLLASGTSPVVRERLLDVLAAAAYSHPGQGKDGYRALWKKIKPPHKPEEGIPFDKDEAMLNPSPVNLTNQYNARNPAHAQSVRQHIIPPHEDMRRLFEECEIGKGNAQLLNQSLTFARPEELSGAFIDEWHRKCLSSHEFLVAQIPWATAQADRSREELRRIYVDENGIERQPIPTSKEEELLAALLAANQELVDVFRIYDDLQRLGIAEKEEREIQERSRKEIKLDRTQIQFISEDGSFQMEDHSHSQVEGSAGPSRSPSPSPTPSFAVLPPMPTPLQRFPATANTTNTANTQAALANLTLSPPRAAPHGPRRARSSSRTPSPPEVRNVPPSLTPQHSHSHSGSLGLDMKRLGNLSFESLNGHELGVGSRRSSLSGERTPIVPSAKAMGKRRAMEECADDDDQNQPEDFIDGRISPFGADSSDHDDSSIDGTERRWRKPVKYVYDAAADRARELRHDLGIPSPTTATPMNGYRR